MLNYPITSLSLEDKRAAALAAAKRVEQQEAKNTAPKRPLTHRRIDGKKPMGLLDWTQKFRSKLQPGAFFCIHNYEYLIDIYNETAPEMIIIKSAQTGASEYLISYSIHMPAERNGRVLYIMPTVQDVSDFSQSRFSPAIKASWRIAQLLKPATREARGADKVSLKQIGEQYIYFRQATISEGKDPSKQGQEARQLQSTPADAIVFDELDEMDFRAIPIAVERLGASPLKEIRKVSTPTYNGIGIHAEWEQSDQREWFIRCEHCGRWQMLTINHIVQEWDDLERPFIWHGQEADDAWPVCENKRCGKRLNRLAKGKWVARYPGRRVVGYRPTQLFSLNSSLIGIINKLQKVDEASRKQVWTKGLGLPYTPRGGGLSEAMIDGCRREYGHGPIAGERPFAGIDVGRLLHIVIRAKANDDGERRQLWAGAVSSFDEVARILKLYNVAGFVIDGLPETRMARSLQAQFPDGLGWLAYYGGSEKGEVIDFNKKDGVVNLARTILLDEMFAGFIDQKTNTIPAYARDIEDYYAHLMAPKRKLYKKDDGNEVAFYDEGSDPDHYAHAEAYCLAAEKRPFVQHASSKPNVVKRAEMFS